VALYDDLKLDDTIDGIKEGSPGNYYVSNPALLQEMIISKERGKLTDNAVKMIVLIATNLSKKLKYENPEDREDCIEFAILDCLQYWQNFNPERSKNPFAYFTSVISNGYAKGWRKLGYHNFPKRIMTSLSSNIHSI